MQIPFTKSRNGSRGFALIITMLFLGVTLLIFASMMYWVSGNAKINQRNNQYNMSQAAAEAATERVLAPMMRDFLNQSLTNASYYAALQVGQTNFDGTPWPVQYVFSNSVIPGVPLTTLEPLGSKYANLKGYPWCWTNIATATPIGQEGSVRATVTQIINFSSVPIFQYAIFYNINLEIDPGATMFVNGPVWSNQGLWAGTANLTFNSTVSAVNQADTTGTDPFCSGKTDGGGAHFNLASQPTHGNTAVTMPIAGATNSSPTNVESILNIPPAAYGLGTPSAYTTNGQLFLANQADLIISNSASGINSSTPHGTNITIYYQYSGGTPALTKLTNDFFIITNTGLPFATNYVSPSLISSRTNISYAGWSFLTNVAFYDYRESATVQAVQIDVAKFNSWLTNMSRNGGSNYNFSCNFNKGHTIDSFWVYNSVPLTTTTLPGVRVVNGIQLPNSWGFTVATPMPIYVFGDYNKQIDATHVSSGTNTLYTYPAALMGDSITVLSGSWSDDYSLTHTSDVNPNSRNASPTVVNAAMLEGIVQSTGTHYSGGVENFLRYLEDWTNDTNTYNGSIVVMFPSVYATNYWITPGTYYNAPKRSWGFDLNFTQQAKLPPLTPQLKKLVRVSWDGQ